MQSNLTDKIEFNLDDELSPTQIESFLNKNHEMVCLSPAIHCGDLFHKKIKISSQIIGLTVRP